VTLRIDVFTIFPELVESYCAASVLGRAAERDVWRLVTHDVRASATGVHRSVDDAPFGGGAGMVMRPGPIVAAVRAVPDVARPLIALTPAGRPFDQAMARELADRAGFSLLCGRYEGMDERALDLVADDEVSLGDFVLAGGELAALCVIEAVVRLRPGALGNDASVAEESFGDGLIEYPQYTQPAIFEDRAVPEVLRSGDHGRVAAWRRAQSVRRTLARRPDLLTEATVNDADRALLVQFPDEARPSS
jgi:tRNA (guanine37-N1)-methyltransferase